MAVTNPTTVAAHSLRPGDVALPSPSAGLKVVARVDHPHPATTLVTWADGSTSGFAPGATLLRTHRPSPASTTQPTPDQEPQ